MELTAAQRLRLGVFVLTGATVLVGALLVVAGLSVLEKRDRYTVRFTESVSGLEPSAQVKYQGLRVGRVETMRIAGDNPEQIEITLSLDPDVVLHEGAMVMLDTSGLTGLKSINITPGDPRKPRLPPGSRLETGPSMFSQLQDHAMAIAKQLEKITSQLASWTTDDTRRRIEKLVDGLDSFVRNTDVLLVSLGGPMSEALRGFGKLTTEGAATVAALREPISRIGPDQLTDTLSSVRAASDMFRARMDDKEAGVAIAELTNTLGKVDKMLKEIDMVVRSSREDFTSSFRYLRESAEDLREFSRIIAQDPSILLRGTEGSAGASSESGAGGQ